MGLSSLLTIKTQQPIGSPPLWVFYLQGFDYICGFTQHSTDTLCQNTGLMLYKMSTYSSTNLSIYLTIYLYLSIYLSIYLYLHKSSFKLEHKRTSITLSDHVWKLKNKNIDCNIKWEIATGDKKNYPSLGLRHLYLKRTKLLDISCTRNDSISTISTIYSHMVTV